MAPAPAVTAVVLHWNREYDTDACVASLAAQTYEALDVLIVDNGSTDGSGTRLAARHPQAHLLRLEENRGYTGGNNAGIAWALVRGAAWVLVLNDDTVAEPDCVAELVAAAADPRVAAVTPLVTRYDDPSRVWFAGGSYLPFRAMGRHDHYGAPVGEVVAAAGGRTFVPSAFVNGCCLLLRAEALGAVGAFREAYFAYGEDTELSLRYRRAGWRIGWAPAARLAHRVPADDTPPSPFQIRHRDRNRRRLVAEHYGPAMRLGFAGWFYPTRALHLLRYLAAGDGARARAVWAGMFGV